MKITLALLADQALAHPDGKLYVTGGGMRRLYVAQLPARYPHLALALQLTFDPEEAGQKYQLKVTSVQPNGQQFRPSAIMPITPVLNRLQPNAATELPVVFNLVDLTFSMRGTYLFTAELGPSSVELPLEVALVSPTHEPDVPALPPWDAQLQEGFNAFQSGDSTAAEAIFVDLISKYPELGVGHNNLGFVRLARNDGEGARRAFQKASELGFGNPELLEANVACCDYLDRLASKALAQFLNCFQARTFPGNAVLFGIDGKGLFPVGLESAADYAGLMALNGAWSAFRAKETETSVRLLRHAEASTLVERRTTAENPYLHSVRELEALVLASRD